MAASTSQHELARARAKAIDQVRSESEHQSESSRIEHGRYEASCFASCVPFRSRRRSSHVDGDADASSLSRRNATQCLCGAAGDIRINRSFFTAAAMSTHDAQRVDSCGRVGEKGKEQSFSSHRPASALMIPYDDYLLPLKLYLRCPRAVLCRTESEQARAYLLRPTLQDLRAIRAR
jgi:hypothetical protein